MRTSYCTWGMMHVDIEEALPAIAEIGYHGIELAVTPGRPTALDTLDDTRRKRIAQLLDEHNLVLSAVAGHTSMCETGDKNEANMQRLRATIDLTADLAQVLRRRSHRPGVLSGGQAGEQPIMASLVGGRADAWDALREVIAERVHALGEYAANRGVVLAVEPHSGNSLDTPEKALWLMKEVNHPAVRLNFDISHFDIIGIGIDACVPDMVPWSAHTHVKDQRGRYPNHEFLTPGSGPFDFVHYLTALHHAGYSGFIGMEVSVMVQRKPGYDPFVDAALGYYALLHAFNESGVPLEKRE